MVFACLKIFIKPLRKKDDSNKGVNDKVKFQQPESITVTSLDQKEKKVDDATGTTIETSTTNEINNGKSFRRVYIVSLAVSLFTLLNVLNWVWLGIVIVQLEDDDAPFKITDEQMAYLHHASQVTSLLATFTVIPIANIWGRKLALFNGVIPYCIMSIIYYFGNSFQALFIARTIAGFASGSIGTVVHVYLTEISPAESRGKISSMSAILGSFGSIVGTIIMPLMSIQQSAILLFIAPVVAAALFFCIAPESPYFFVLKNNRTKAEESIQALNRSTDDVDKMMKHRNEHKENNYSDLVTVRGNRKALFYAIVLHFASSFTGAGPVSFYATLIFRRESSFSWHYSLIILSVSSFLINLISGDLADRFGRRPLLLASCWSTSLVLFILGWYFHEKSNFSPELTRIVQFTPLAGLLLMRVATHMGLAQVNRLASSELFPTHLRVSSSAIRKVLGTILSVVVIQIYQFLSTNFGLWWPFWFFGGMTIVNGVAGYSLYPETKGKTFEEIQEYIHKDDDIKPNVESTTTTSEKNV